MILKKMIFRENEVYLTDLRIKPQDRIKGLYYYDIRHDEKGTPCSIEHGVLMNHWGTIVSIKNIDNILDIRWKHEKKCTYLIEDDNNDLDEIFSLYYTINDGEEEIKYNDLVEKYKYRKRD